MKQLRQTKVHLCGIQEFRPLSAGITECEGFIVCKSSADDLGGHGCGVVINSSIPWFTRGEGEIAPKRDDVSIMMACNRTICVAVQTREVDLLIMSAHGPLKSSSDADITCY